MKPTAATSPSDNPSDSLSPARAWDETYTKAEESAVEILQKGVARRKAAREQQEREQNQAKA